MRVLLVLTVGSAALPGSPRTLPALKLRGGGVRQPLARCRPRQGAGRRFVVLGGFDQIRQYLAASRRSRDRLAARRCVGAGRLVPAVLAAVQYAATAKNWAMVARSR